MHTPANGPKNAPQPRPASPAPITPPSRKASPVMQALQVLSMYAALVAVVCLLVTTCSPATAQTIARTSQPGYAGPARESDGQTLAGLSQKAHSPHPLRLFCASLSPMRALWQGLGGTPQGVPVSFCAGRPTRPSPVTTFAMAATWQDSTNKRSLNHG